VSHNIQSPLEKIKNKRSPSSPLLHQTFPHLYGIGLEIRLPLPITQPAEPFHIARMRFGNSGKKQVKRCDRGPEGQAQLNNPSGLAVDLDGNLYLSEFGNHRIRRVNAKSKVITTIGGNGLPYGVDITMD
jgi:NHL repeat